VKKLTKEMLDQRDELCTALATAIDAIQTKGSEIDDLVLEYNGGIAKLNEVVADAREFVGNVSAALQEYADDKSDKWRESDAGNEYEDWIAEWENVDLTDAEELQVSTDTSDFDGAVSALEELPTEPG
jgi:hypothetical protein